MLQDALSAHRSMLMGALHCNPELDIERAFQVHAGICRILTRWDHYDAAQQREIVRTIEYVINPDDEQNDLTSPNGFADDLAEFNKLREYLGSA